MSPYRSATKIYKQKSKPIFLKRIVCWFKQHKFLRTSKLEQQLGLPYSSFHVKFCVARCQRCGKSIYKYKSYIGIMIQNWKSSASSSYQLKDCDLIPNEDGEKRRN
jgi:hypothetical protein